MHEELSDNFAMLERTISNYCQNRRQFDLPEEPRKRWRQEAKEKKKERKEEEEKEKGRFARSMKDRQGSKRNGTKNGLRKNRQKQTDTRRSRMYVVSCGTASKTETYVTSKSSE